MLTRACNKIESNMMSSSINSHSSNKSTTKNNAISPKEYSEASNIHKTKTSLHSPPSSSFSIKTCSPPLKSSGSTTSTKPSTSPIGSIPSFHRVQSPQQGITTPKTSTATPPSSTKVSTTPPSTYTMSNPTQPSVTMSSVIPPNSLSAYASLTSPSARPNMSLIAEMAASNPCTDPLCRDSSCPTTIMHQYASLMAAAGSSTRPNPYPFSPMTIPPLAGMPQLASNTNQDSSQPPLICNWMSGGEFCGKRFPSGEELNSHLRLHTSSGSSSTAAATSTASKHMPQLAVDPALAALQAAQIQALYPHLSSPSSSSASTSALAALQLQAARAASSSTSPLSQPPTTTTASFLSQSSKSPLDSSMASAMAMASAMQAAQATASAQVAASSRYHPYARHSAPILPPSIMGGLGASTTHFSPPSLPFPSSYLPSAFPAYLQSPYGMPLL